MLRVRGVLHLSPPSPGAFTRSVRRGYRPLVCLGQNYNSLYIDSLSVEELTPGNDAFIEGRMLHNLRDFPELRAGVVLTVSEGPRNVFGTLDVVEVTQLDDCSIAGGTC